jgi:hypothetical protein
MNTKKFVAVTTAMCLGAIMLSGCFGPFRLTKKMYDWNGSFPNKWGREAMFLVLSILPVYGFSAFADAIIFNTIEFWGGESPLAVCGKIKSRCLVEGDRQAVLTFSRTGDRLRIDLFNNHRPVNYVTIESSNDGAMIARDPRDEVIMVARTLDDGSVFVIDKKGKEVACHIPGD